jgi:hypothetical protein
MPVATFWRLAGLITYVMDFEAIGERDQPKLMQHWHWGIRRKQCRLSISRGVFFAGAKFASQSDYLSLVA